MNDQTETRTVPPPTIKLSKLLCTCDTMVYEEREPSECQPVFENPSLPVFEMTARCSPPEEELNSVWIQSYVNMVHDEVEVDEQHLNLTHACQKVSMSSAPRQV